MDKNEVAVKVMALVATGMDMGEALAKVLAEYEEANKNINTREVVDPMHRTEWISSLSDLQALRNAIKIAFAKKSKTKDSNSSTASAAIARYEKEIKAGQMRALEIQCIIDKAADPIAKAIEFNEDDNHLIQIYLGQNEKKQEKVLDGYKAKAKITNAELKVLMNKTTAETPEKIINDLKKYRDSLVKTYTERAKNDQRLIKMNRMVTITEKKA
jgi:uncharacterized protein YoaH (UPF0181 family)